MSRLAADTSEVLSHALKSVANPAATAIHGVETNTTGSFHPGGCNFVLADGSVQSVSQNITQAIYQQRGARNDGLPAGGDVSSSQ